ncbi:hypothetical protein DPMN_060123 [Dreissena polymorpha]|uniref:Uncharacterized protein n=1 Tax=Dreissena polymorpha TaxID=45954 RepID=A0A9D4C561_DREPO|nr:hypothetical protein DPMN_060123 [Dreissena polymorpha]
MFTDDKLVYGSYICEIVLREDDTHLGRTLPLQGLSLLWCTTVAFFVQLDVKVDLGEFRCYKIGTIVSLFN